MVDDVSKTLYVGNISQDTTEEILYELFLQGGPVEYVTRPKDRQTNVLKPFAFVCYKHECSVPYALYLLDGIVLDKRTLKIQTRTKSQRIPPVHEVGIHSLDSNFSPIQASVSAPEPQQFLSHASNPPVMARLSHNSGISLLPIPFGVPLMNGVCNPPRIDTNSLNSLKHSYNAHYNNHDSRRTPDNYDRDRNYRNNAIGYDQQRQNSSDSNSRYSRRDGNDHYQAHTPKRGPYDSGHALSNPRLNSYNDMTPNYRGRNNKSQNDSPYDRNSRDYYSNRHSGQSHNSSNRNYKRY